MRQLLIAGLLASMGAGSAHGLTAPEDPPGQEASELVRIDVRVTSRGSGLRVGIDRGETDGIAEGDPVTFRPRTGRTVLGRIVKVFERWASVEIQSEALIPEPGTRAVVLVPRSRLDGLGLGASGDTTKGPSRPEAPVSAGPAPSGTEEGWTPEMPLLTPIRVQNPAMRDRRVSGRIYSTGRYIGTDQAGRSDAILRTGVHWTVENPVQRAGVLEFDAELDYRRAEVPFGEDQSNIYLRLDRLSYRLGGHRFAPESLEFGRFLQNGMPEFGVLDGAEWNVRQPSGNTFGVSVGALPEPDEKASTGSDLQLAAFYRWVDDVDEVLSFAAGVQKSFHNGDSDRDLLVAAFHFLPPKGWDFSATVWVDYYGGSERSQVSGIEVTQLVASASRRYENGAGIQWSATHFGFPDIEREEFLPPDPDEIVDLRSDRLSVAGWRPFGDDRRVHGRLSGWSDHDESGGDIESGLGIEDVLFAGDEADGTVFFTQGDFSTVVGARASLSREVEEGRWDLLYEVTSHAGNGDGSVVDAIVQHRLRGSREFHVGREWYLSLSAEGVIWDDAASWSLGFYLQRSF